MERAFAVCSQRAKSSPLPEEKCASRPERARGRAQLKRWHPGGSGGSSKTVYLPAGQSFLLRTALFRRRKRTLCSRSPTVSRHRCSQWLIHGVQEKYFCSCTSFRCKWAWHTDAGRPAGRECPVPVARPPPAAAGPSLASRGVPWAPRASGAHRDTGVLSALSSFLVLPFREVPPRSLVLEGGWSVDSEVVPGAMSAAPEHVEPWKRLWETVYTKYHLPSPMPSSPPKYFREAPAAAPTVGKPDSCFV